MNNIDNRVGYRVGEVAEMLGMSVSAVRRGIKTGVIPSERVNNSDIVPAWWLQDKFSRPVA